MKLQKAKPKIRGDYCILYDSIYVIYIKLYIIYTFI